MEGFKIFVLFWPFVVADQFMGPVDYCDKKLCGAYQIHIACRPQVYGIQCGNVTSTVDIEPFKDVIVATHNDCRNKTAAGVIGSVAASNMQSLSWDRELEFLALSNAKRCVGEHDKCRNTPRFPNSGQNIFRKASLKKFDIGGAMKNGIDKWCSGHEQFKPEYTKVFPDVSKLDPISNYARIVQDANGRVGCGAVLQIANDVRTLHFVCNYATNINIGKPVFATGPARDCCQHGVVDKQYKGLCGQSFDIAPEPILPNRAQGIFDLSTTVVSVSFWFKIFLSFILSSIRWPSIVYLKRYISTIWPLDLC